MSFIANFIRFPAVQNFENRLRFDNVSDSLKVRTFSETECRIFCMFKVCCKRAALYIFVQRHSVAEPGEGHGTRARSLS